MHDSTDQILLRAFRRGDEAAARALHASLSPLLAAYARSVLRDESLAEDAVQSAFCKVFRASVSEVDRVDSPRAWLARVVRRESLSILRTARRMLRRHERAMLERASASAVEGALALAPDELAEVGACVEALPRAMREIVVLRHVCGLTFDQVALALGANRNTVASRYRAALARLEAAMASTGPRREHSRAR